MAKTNYDGVLETAHFKSDGQLDWVRVYERMGAVFSDRVVLSRDAFVQQLKKGKRYWIGERIHNMGGKFNVSKPVHLLQQGGKEVIALGDTRATEDNLAGVPII